jgi:hypothetical protein
MTAMRSAFGHLECAEQWLPDPPSEILEIFSCNMARAFAYAKETKQHSTLRAPAVHSSDSWQC